MLVNNRPAFRLVRAEFAPHINLINLRYTMRTRILRNENHMHEQYHLIPLHHFNRMLGGTYIETGNLDKDIHALKEEIINLVSAGKRPTDSYEGYTPLMLYACFGMNDDLAQELEKSTETEVTLTVELEVDVEPKPKMSALDFAACSTHSTDCLAALYSTGYFKPTSAEHAAFFAAEFGSDQAINYFIENKINLFSDSFSTGFTPLHVACMRGHTSVVEKIVYHTLLYPVSEDTRINTVTKTDEMTAYQYAEQNKHYDCCALINAYYFNRTLSAIDTKNISDIPNLLKLSPTVTDIYFLHQTVTYDFNPEIQAQIIWGIPQSLIGSIAVKAIKDPRYYQVIFPLVEQYLDGQSVTEQVENYMIGISYLLLETSWDKEQREPMLSRMLKKLNGLSDKFDQVTQLKIDAAHQNEMLWDLILRILASAPLCEITFYTMMQPNFGYRSNLYAFTSCDLSRFHLNQKQFISAILCILNNPSNTALTKLNLKGGGGPYLAEDTTLSSWIKLLNLIAQRNELITQADKQFKKIDLFNEYSKSINSLITAIKDNKNQPQEREMLKPLVEKKAVYPLKELVELSIIKSKREQQNNESNHQPTP